MSLLDRIPLPGLDLGGFEQGQKLMDRFLSAPIERRAKQEDILYKQGHLGILQRAENRAQTLMPYLIQRYKDAHGQHMSEKSMSDLYNNLIKQAYSQDSNQNNTQTNPNSSTQQQNDMPNSSIDASQGLPFSPQNMTQPMGMNQSSMGGYSPIEPSQSAGINNLEALMNSSKRAPIPSDQSHITPEESQKNGMPTQNNEEVLRPGNPKLSALDRIAGLPKSPISAPKTEIDRKNGYIYTQYPSGKITRQKMSGNNEEGNPYRETSQQKQERAIKTAEGKENVKQAIKLEDSGRALKSMVDKAKDIHKLLQENPNLTGKLPWLAEKTGIGTPENLGSFTEKTRKLQADIGRYGSTRGGAQALKWAETSKPSTWQGSSYNKEMLQGMLQDAKNDYEEMRKEYKERTGKDYPIKIDFPDNTNKVKVKKPNGDIIDLPEEGAKRLIKDHPNYQIVNE